MARGIGVVRSGAPGALASTMLRGYISTDSTISLHEQIDLNGGVIIAEKPWSTALKDFHSCKRPAAAAAFAGAWCLILPFEH